MVQFRRGRKSPWMVQIRDANGNVKTHSFDRKEDAAEFEAKERRNRKLSKAGLELPKEDILFIDRVASYLRKVQKTNAYSSFRQDESRFRNYWLDKFGNRPIATMTTAEIKEHLDYIHFELDHTPADRNRHRALLHSFFQDAFMDNKVVANPVAKIPLIDETGRRRKFGKVESEKDWERYLRAMYKHGRQFGIMSEIMAWTGARVMAAAALQWRDVDFKNQTVVLRRLVERASGTVVERTKGRGEGGTHVVPLVPRLRHSLNAHRANSEYIRPTDFIASQPGGRFITYEEYRHVREQVLEETALQPFTPHAVRAFFATNAKKAGYTRAELRELLDHSSEAVTARYDMDDAEHLKSKAKRIGFGKHVSAVSAKRSETSGRKGRKRA